MYELVRCTIASCDDDDQLLRLAIGSYASSNVDPIAFGAGGVAGVCLPVQFEQRPGEPINDYEGQPCKPFLASMRRGPSSP